MPVFRKIFAPLLPKDKKARILDLGCGYGDLVYFLQSSGYENVVGIDRDRVQLGVGQELGVKNMHCIGADEFLHEHREEFDAIAAIDVLEHIPKSQVLDFLARIHDSLRCGGRLICQVPNLAAFYAPLYFMDFTHESPFTGTSLKQVMEVAEFENIRILPVGPIVHGFRSAIRKILWKGISSGLRFMQATEGGPRGALAEIFTATICGVGDKTKLRSGQKQP
ncbi:MAG: class I SAM-dependent methyltransferase [Acidobacteriia bacterium]|nr:class I SAM-dependent methyltransferase [Terriglobia bacterium]